MTRPTRVISIYEGFFAGGARILHTDVVAGLHGPTQAHSVLAIASRARRENTMQHMEDDPRYRQLRHAGVEVVTLGRTADAHALDVVDFTTAELTLAAETLRDADLVLTLKEQPLALLDALRAHGLMPDVPVATCLHRSDPMHSGSALGRLSAATSDGRVSATISCAESTDHAYAQAGVRAAQRYVIRNGIDTERFAPAADAERRRIRAELGIPSSAAVVVFAARFDAMKDPGLFFRTAAVHAAQHPGTHFVLCGAGMTWDNAAFRALAAESGVREATHVHALGIRQDMPSIYQIADIVALTSAFGEASPLCLIEGAACGATPVTTRVGDSAAVVDGFGVIAPAEPAAMAEAWRGVLLRRRTWRARALAARPHLDRQRMLDDYRVVTETLLGRAEAAA